VIDVAPGTIAVFSDIGCPWSHLAVHRLLATRHRLGLDARVTLDHRPFPLELMNGQPTPKRTLDAEVPVVGGLDPDAGWQLWKGPDWRYPVTMLPALEAVQAAKAQDLGASEQLDRALRVAFFGESRCVSMRHVILEVAEKCDRIDAEALGEALDGGAARRSVIGHGDMAESSHVDGSPHVFLADGFSLHNPGIEMHWEGRPGTGFPIVTGDDPDVYEAILHRAAGGG
jgi:predicted DsbA family dithiol-disulfide isomerase